MSKLTVIIITKNEEEVIEECIDSVSFCDEILLVDNASIDKTIEIGQKKGATVISHKTDSFSDLRNKGLHSAKGEWILYIDADERVSTHLQKEIQKAISEDNNKLSAYTIIRKNFYLGSYPWPAQEKILRLFKKDKLKNWYGKLHESPSISGEIGELKGELLHYTHRNLEYMLQKTIQWSDIEAHLRLESNHPKMVWWRFPRVMLSAFINSYIQQGGWKIGTAGLIESFYQMFSIFITYAKLWELQNKKNEKNS